MHDSYIICGTPRSGSTLLCGLLAATGQAGDPDSFFRTQIVAWWAEQWGLPKRETLREKDFANAYLRAAIEAGRGGTGIFGLRLMRENLADLCAMLGQVHAGLRSDRARLEAAFGRILFLHLTRADKLGQAISLVKAEQSGLWHVAPGGRELERLAAPAEPRYDFARLQRKVRELESDDTAWGIWFAAQGITPCRVSYEELAADPAATLIRLCAALGVPAPQADEVKPGVARLADAVSDEWRRRYLSNGGAVR